MQAARVRKVSFVPPTGDQAVTAAAYDPDTFQSCTIAAGTLVTQV